MKTLQRGPPFPPKVDPLSLPFHHLSSPARFKSLGYFRFLVFILRLSVLLVSTSILTGCYPCSAKVLFLETMSNPTLVVPDLLVLAAMAHERGAKVSNFSGFWVSIFSDFRVYG